jgi:hypothetical protein
MPKTRTSHWRARIGLVAALCAGAAGCGDDRETLLQVDVVVPTGLASSQVHVEVAIGDAETRRFDEALPAAGEKLGIDLPLSRQLAGDFEIWVRLRNAADCLVAENSNWVVLTPGERSRTIVSLVALERPNCDRDAGTTVGGPTDDGGVEQDASPGGDDNDAAGEGDAPAPTEDADPAERDTAIAGPTDGGRPPRDAPAGLDTRPRDAGPSPSDGPPAKIPCAAGCAAGQVCVAGFCEPAPASCAEVKQRTPAAVDGIYMIKVGAAVQRVYCDMAIRKPLCAQTAGAREGLSRDGSALKLAFSSVLDANGACRIWGVRHAGDGYPLDILDGTAMDTCRALGFKGDQSLTRQCKFGANPGYTKCGFVIPEFNKWANVCVGCKLNPGRYPKYVLQGKVFVSSIPWNLDGSVSAFCKVQ